MINRLSIRCGNSNEKFTINDEKPVTNLCDEILLSEPDETRTFFIYVRLQSTISAISNLIQFPTNNSFSLLFSIFVHFLSFKRFIKSKVIALSTVDMISCDYVYFQYKFTSNGKTNGNDSETKTRNTK